MSDLENIATELNEPRSPPLRKNDGLNTWEQVMSLFGSHKLPSPPQRLNDEIVMLMEWAWYGKEASSEIIRLRQTLANSERKAARAEAEKEGLLQALKHHTGFDHGIMAIRTLVDRTEEAEKREKEARVKALEDAAKVAEGQSCYSVAEAILALQSETRP